MLTPAPEHTDPPPEVVGHKTFRQILPTAKQHHTHSVASVRPFPCPASVGFLGPLTLCSPSLDIDTDTGPIINPLPRFRPSLGYIRGSALQTLSSFDNHERGMDDRFAAHNTHPIQAGGEF
jgi:hypothetical protein